MRKHTTQFDAHQIKSVRNVTMGLPRDRGIKQHDGRVRKGKMKEGSKLLSDAMNEKMDAKWKSFVQPVIGYSSYAEMRAGINKELERPLGQAA